MDLERPKKVFERFNFSRLAPKTIIVAGTNGKGSTLSYLESVLSASGYKVAKYTSPHIYSFTERIVINNQNVSEKLLVDAFDYVEEKKQGIVLTYFEYTTLAAFYCIYHSKVDIALLEVGLGGRLDAVNIINRDINLITNIQLDHTNWLGKTRKEIAKEKFGINRFGVPLYCSDTKPLSNFKTLVPTLKIINKDFSLKGKTYQSEQSEMVLDLPNELLEHQKNNLALVLRTIENLKANGLKISKNNIETGIHNNKNFARQSFIFKNGVQYLLDVAHNEASAKALYHCLGKNKYSNIYAVFSILNDKNICKIVDILKKRITHWYISPLNTDRSIKLQNLEDIFIKKQLKYCTSKCAKQSFNLAKAQYKKGDLIVVFGSFYLLSELRIV